MVIRLVIDLGKLVKGILRGGECVGGWGKRYVGCWVLWPLCVLGYIPIVVVEGACIRDCRELGLCIVGTVG
jgi:hypothetical protein